MFIRVFDHRTKQMYQSYVVLGWNGSIEVWQNDKPLSEDPDAKTIDIGCGCEVFDDYDGEVEIMYGFRNPKTREMIYEKDIVRNEAFVDVVELENGCFVIKNSLPDKFGIKQPVCVHDNIKVVGNVLENQDFVPFSATKE